MNKKYFLYLSGVINENQYLDESKGKGIKHYMFFANIRAIKDMCEKMLEMDEAHVDELLDDGHDWASDHISTSKDDVEEVYNWLSHRGDQEPKGKA